MQDDGRIVLLIGFFGSGGDWVTRTSTPGERALYSLPSAQCLAGGRRVLVGVLLFRPRGHFPSRWILFDFVMPSASIANCSGCGRSCPRLGAAVERALHSDHEVRFQQTMSSRLLCSPLVIVRGGVWIRCFCWSVWLLGAGAEDAGHSVGSTVGGVRSFHLHRPMRFQ